MTFDDLQFLDTTWDFEIPVKGKRTHQNFSNGYSLSASQNDRLEGYNEGKFVVEIYRRGEFVEWLVLSPDEITTKIQEIESYQT